MRVAAILKTKGDAVATVIRSAPLAAAVHAMHAANIGALVVVDPAGHIVGLLSEKDIVAALGRWAGSALSRAVGEAMTVEVTSVKSADPVREVMALMTERRARHLLVIDDGVLCGLLSIGDVLKSRLTERTEEINVLQDIARFHHAA